MEWGERKALPNDRDSITTSITIGGIKMFITAGMYEDGSLGEIFIKGAGGEGSTMGAMMDSFATAISYALQYGCPLEMIATKFHDKKFEPHGLTDHPRVGEAKSMLDGLFKWLVAEFSDDEKLRKTVRLP